MNSDVDRRGIQSSPGQANVRGSIDKEIIRRIIRRHPNEVKYCYETELFRSPALEGRLAVQFTIGNEGRVISSVLQSSTMDNVRVENCVVQAVRHWEFPRPAGGGIALVSYPFTFIPRAETKAETVPAVERTTAPKPADHFTKALAALRSKGELSIRLAKMAEILEAPASDNRRVLAWWIVEQYLRSGQPAVAACVPRRQPLARRQPPPRGCSHPVRGRRKRSPRRHSRVPPLG